jgi:hypothetical protein
MGHGIAWESEKSDFLSGFFNGIWRYAIMGFTAFYLSTVVDTHTHTHTHFLLLHITLLLLLSHPLFWVAVLQVYIEASWTKLKYYITLCHLHIIQSIIIIVHV